MSRKPFFILIGGILALAIAMGIGRFAYTPILPIMQNELSFSNATAGMLATSNYAGYLVGAILASVVPIANNRIGLLRASLIVSVITTIMMGFVHNIFVWNALRFFSGVASAFVFVPVSSVVLDELARVGKTNWSGLLYGGVGIGIVFTSILTPSLNNFFAWQGTWIGTGILATILTFFVWLWLKNPNSTIENKSQNKIIKTPPKHWLTILTIAYGLQGLGYIVTGTFIVAIAEQSGTFNNASLVWLVVGLVSIPSCFFWSQLASNWGYVKSLVFATGAQAIGIVLPVVWLTKTSFFISAFLYGVTFLGIVTLTTTLGRQIDPNHSGRVIAIMTSVYATGQMIGPFMAGILADYTNHFSASLIGAAVTVFIGTILLVSGLKYENNPYNKAVHIKSKYK